MATVILRDSFARTKNLTYDWQFRALRQSTSSELTWLIQLLFSTIATRWRPRGCWWRQKWIINMWQIVGPLITCFTYLWSTFGVINILEGTTLWRSPETEVGSTKSILMKCFSWEHKTVNCKSTFWFGQMNLLILSLYKPDESIQG